MVCRDLHFLKEKPPHFAKFPELYDALKAIPADITLSKLDDMAGVMKTIEVTPIAESDSNSTTTSGFFGESTSEADVSGGSSIGSIGQGSKFGSSVTSKSSRRLSGQAKLTPAFKRTLENSLNNSSSNSKGSGQ